MERAAEELRVRSGRRELRDRIQAIELLGMRQKVVAGSLADTDVTGFFRGTAKSCFVSCTTWRGSWPPKTLICWKPRWKRMRRASYPLWSGNTMWAVTVCPGRYCSLVNWWTRSPLTRLLSEQVERKVELVTPQRGAKMDLIRLANQNAREEVERATTREERQSKLMELLGRMLDLDAPPRRIESYDISNTGASDIVASMVVYVDGRPLKRDYRRFKLKDMEGPDDYAPWSRC